MNIAILMLCHETPAAVADSLRSPFFQDPGVKVYLHYDLQRSPDQFQQLKLQLPKGIQVFILEHRVRCKWGEYSLVDATKRLMDEALKDDVFRGERLVLLSGSCMPFRAAASLRSFLENFPQTEFIEAADAERKRWVQDGLQEERYQLYFPFNFKTHRRWFERSVTLQKKLRIRRKLPANLRIHFGSQWFCLTRQTSQHVVARLSDPVNERFLKKCWIPDEFAIQSFVAEVATSEKIAGHSLTYYEFDAWGRPLVLENDHYEHLMAQPFFFARKVAPGAHTLRRQINESVKRVETSLSYFNKVGTPTPDYRCYMARASTVKAARGHVGSLEDDWRGVMDRNERAYIVLWSSCLPYARALIETARKESRSDLMILDLLHTSQIGDRACLDAKKQINPTPAWIDYAPAASLYEFVNSHPTQLAAVLVDPSLDNWYRNFVPWDSNALIVCLDPPNLTKVQRAEAALREAPRYWSAAMVKSIYSAAFTNNWLPQEHFLKIAAEKSIFAKISTLGNASEHLPTDLFKSLQEAQKKMSLDLFFRSDHMAWVQLRRALPSLSISRPLTSEV